MKKITGCHRQSCLVILTVLLHLTCSYSQTFSGRRVPVKEALDKVSELFGTKFVYERATVRNKTTTVDVASIKNQPVEEILKTILYPNNLLFLYVDRNHYTIVPKSARTETAQQPATATNSVVETLLNNPEAATENPPLHITGIVTDSLTSKPLSGVTVSLKGTSNGDVTDNSGKFSINARNASNPVLEFTMIGYKMKQWSVNGRSDVSISLATETSGLGEVVVVGYGTQNKRNVTGAIAKVDMKQLENLPNTNISQALRGRVAGVQFIDNARPGQGGSILIRGTRSLNGGNNPLIILDGIQFNSSIADINPNDIESMEILKDASAAAIYGSRAANGVILITSKKGKSDKPTLRVNAFYGVSDWSHTLQLLSPERYTQALLDWRKQSGLPSDPLQIDKYLQASEAENYRAGKIINPWNAIAQDGKISAYDFSISGRSSTTNYFLSGSLTDEKGLIFNDNQKRISVRANIENKLSNWLTIGLNTSFIQRDLSGREADILNAYWTSPYGKLFYDDGQPTRYPVPEEQLVGNPVRNAMLTENEEIYNNLFSNFYALVNIPRINGLNYRFNFSPNYRWRHNYNFFRQDVNLNSNTTSASKFNQENYDWVLENILTYKRRINASHAFDVTLLYGRNQTHFESTTANAAPLSNPTLGWNSLNLGEIQTVNSSAEQSNGISSMFRLNYQLKSRYIFTFTMRRDGSSVFAENNKYANFPSAAVAWVLSDEGFLQHSAFINSLKVRASYGSVGNQAIGPYQSLSLSGTTQYVFGDGGATSTGVSPVSIANPNLKWETTSTLR